jgi:hypothetical protein
MRAVDLIPDGTWQVMRRLRYSRARRIVAGLPQFGFTVGDCHFALEFQAGWIASLRCGQVQWSAGSVDPGLSAHHSAAPLDRPRFVCADAGGNLLVTDANGVWRLDRRTRDLVRLIDAATLGVAEPGNCLASGDRLWLSDIVGHQVWELTAQGFPLRRFGNGTRGFQTGTVDADRARFGAIYDARCDSAGNVFILDSTNFAVRRIGAVDGSVSTVCGDGVPGLAGDGGPATRARLGGSAEDDFDGPWSLAVSPEGDIFIGDTHNHAVRRIAASTGRIATIAAASSPSPEVEGERTGLNAASPLFTRICGMDLTPEGLLRVPDWVSEDHDELLVLRPAP